MRSSRSATGLAIEQNAFSQGLAHQGAWLFGSAGHFAARVEHQVDRQIRLGHGTPQVSEQRKAVALRQPGIRHGDQQVHIGIGPVITSGPRSEQSYIGSGNQLANAGNHARQPRLDRFGGCGGSHHFILTATGFAR